MSGCLTRMDFIDEDDGWDDSVDYDWDETDMDDIKE